jgi:putative ABC transport system permease protein
MPTNAFINFLFLLLYRHRHKHLAITFIAAITVFVFSAVMMMAYALKYDITTTLEVQPDFIVQKIRSGNRVDVPLQWGDSLLQIEGVSNVIPRVYGTYFFQPDAQYFTIIGIDPFDTQTTTLLHHLIENLDVAAFLQEPSIIIGSGVKQLFDQYRYSDDYTFKTPNQEKIHTHIHAVLPASGALSANDIVVMPNDLARQILGIDDDQATDFALYVPNATEADTILAKLILSHIDARVITKTDTLRAYEHLFNYKGGLFLVVFMIVLLTFMIILYQRYSMILGSDKKEIGILRSIGWSIKDVIMLKMLESFSVAFFAFLVGFIAAYAYIFVADAPLLGAIFFGHENLPSHFELSHIIDWQLFGLIFLGYMTPFMAAVLVPVWRIAITDPLEAMR